MQYCDFEAVADTLCPTIHRWHRRPQRIITFSSNKDGYFGVKPSTAYPISKLPSLSWAKGSEFILDFGLHMVGFLSFKLACVSENMDAPCRLRLTFGESPLDVTMGMDGVKTWISTAWLPDEIINIDTCPEAVALPRRYSFRFLRVQIIDTSNKFQVAFSDVKCDCVSAVSQEQKLDIVDFNSQLLQDIDHISISTLRDCMHMVFEDGPRRDRRLWIGDFRLQALANYSTFRDFGLVKRCLFLLAAVRRKDGSLPANIFLKPTLSASTDYIADYDALYSVIVYEYVLASGDLETGITLWEVAQQCVKRAILSLNPRTYVFEMERTKDFKFVDWEKGLDKNASLHGILLFCLKTVNKLAMLIGKEAPYTDAVTRMTLAAKAFYKDGVFISGSGEQISYASASWLTLSGAFPSEVARAALLRTIAHPSAIKPLTPYLWHYVCDALLTVGCYDECLEIITSYWGRMVYAGADTFWECFDPSDMNASPYGDVRNNSFCHAWSCTPTYLLREKLFSRIQGKVLKKISMREFDELWAQRSSGN